jgi:hypothetical protein
MPELGPWLPDLPPYGHQGLTVARNVYASPLGYRPVKDLSAVTTAIPSAWQGGGSFIDLDGTTVTLAGTNAGLYVYSGTAWTLKYGGVYSSDWFFGQYGSFIIGVNGGQPVKYTISTATGALLGGSPPNATMLAIVRDFVFMAGNSAANGTVYWSGNNNAENWTIGTGECDIQPLPDGGPITGIAGGEYGLVFQEAAIHRFSYVGSALIFQRDKISDGIGCIAPGAIATFGRMTFFLSGRGFYVIQDGELSNIGDQKINETFWKEYSRPDVQNNIRCAIDPKRTLVIWSMLDRLWVYNWTLDRWTDIYVPGIIGLSTGINASVSLEYVDVLYPGGLDSVPYSLDDPIFKGGEPLLTVVKSDNIVYSFGSALNLPSTLTFPTLELIPGRVTRVRRSRLYSDALDGVTLTLGYASRLGDPFTTVVSNEVRSNGFIPIRASGQFLQPRINLSATSGWSYANAISFDQAVGGNG